MYSSHIDHVTNKENSCQGRLGFRRLFTKVAFWPAGLHTAWFFTGTSIPGGCFSGRFFLGSLGDRVPGGFLLGGLFPDFFFPGWLYVWTEYFSVSFFPWGFCTVVYFLDSPTLCVSSVRLYGNQKFLQQFLSNFQKSWCSAFPRSKLWGFFNWMTSLRVVIWVRLTLHTQKKFFLPW